VCNLLARPYPLEGRHGPFEANISASIGIALWKETSDDEELIQAADRALYRAKDGGRNRCAMAAD
jgi:diguanylate cyclase (GGDEF)-like protein